MGTNTPSRFLYLLDSDCSAPFSESPRTSDSKLNSTTYTCNASSSDTDFLQIPGFSRDEVMTRRSAMPDQGMCISLGQRLP
eukprot:2502455-Amphidinium_carterae.1